MFLGKTKLTLTSRLEHDSHLLWPSFSLSWLPVQIGMREPALRGTPPVDATEKAGVALPDATESKDASRRNAHRCCADAAVDLPFAVCREGGEEDSLFKTCLATAPVARKPLGLGGTGGGRRLFSSEAAIPRI